MKSELKLSLIENSIDYIESSIKYAQQTEPNAWKHSLLNITASLELLMKAILENEHWSLLFENVDSASKHKLNCGDFKSVNFETSIKRIKEIIGLKLSPNDEKYLLKLRDLRNKTIHFSIQINLEELKSIIARGLNIYLYLAKELHNFVEDYNEFVHYVNSQLIEFDKYVKLHLSVLGEKLNSCERPPSEFSSCPNCLQDTLVCQSNKVNCLFCGHEMTFKELADTCSEGSGGPCPECLEGELALILYNNDDGEFICVKCGFKTQHSYNRDCSICGNVFWDEDGSDMCEACSDSIYK